MSSSFDNNTKKKKRRIDDEGAALPTVQGREDGLSRALNQLLDHSRSQMAIMTNMQHEMNNIQGEMKYLREKCDTMERSLQTVHNMVGSASSNMLETAYKFRDRVDSRFADVECKQKYHEVLLRNQKWEYLVPPPSANFWNSIDHRQRVRSFLDQIKKETCEMKQGGDNADISLNCFRHQFRYHEVLLPHWREFANALEEYQYALKCSSEEKKSSLSLWYVELPATVLGVLSNALQSTHFKSFSLANNNFGRDGIKFSLDYLQNNPVLEEFDLFNNTINNIEDVNRLCSTVKHHPSVNSIELERCCGRGINGYEMLSSIMTAGASKLKCIDFSFNRVSTEGSTFLAAFLATNPILERLLLCDNLLDDRDTILIASVLMHNTNLQFLNLEDNLMTETGCKALRKAVFDDSSLNLAADSNHTCVIHYTGDERLDCEINGETESGDLFEPKALRGKKIYSILSSRNIECSNIDSLDDVPAELFPDMLRSIQQYSEYHLQDNAPPQDDNDVNALAIVFEIMRKLEKAFSIYESFSIRQPKK